MNRKHFFKTLVPLAIGSTLVKQSFATPDTVLHPHKMPKYLKPGDTIGITCSAGAMTASGLQLCKTALENWGLKVKYGNTVNKQWQRFGGTDAERAIDLEQMLNDASIDAIMFGRGGYGVMRILDQINWSHFAKQPKWLIGYSDITALHCHIHSLYGIATIHGDMGNGFGPSADAAENSLKNMLFGRKSEYNFNNYKLNKQGTAIGQLVGGNLSMLVAVQGSNSALKTNGKILFIEDVSEYKYTIDRMMTNLKRSGMLSNLAGLVFGNFSATKTAEEAYPMSIEQIIYEKVKDYNYPVAFHFPAGHQKENMALKLGAYYRLHISNSSCHLHETNAPIISMPPLQIDTATSTIDTSQLIGDTAIIK
jgi:muramoyltetrapeptide carboxypeptidase